MKTLTLLLMLMVGCCSNNTELVYKVETDTGWGSGSVISCTPHDNGYKVILLTAKHVVQYADDILLRDQVPLSASQDSVHLHPTEDAALVVFYSVKYYEPRGIEYYPTEYGERLFLDGFPAGEGPYRRGGYAGTDGNVSTNAWPGDSGGPICNKDGDIVGILSTILQTYQGDVTFAAHMVQMADIKEWLRKELQ